MREKGLERLEYGGEVRVMPDHVMRSYDALAAGFRGRGIEGRCSCEG